MSRLAHATIAQPDQARENLNMLVKAHIATAASSPSKALATLEHDASELIGSGMRTLNAKLAEKEDDKLVGRIVEIWGFFWDQVLPYVEGVCPARSVYSLSADPAPQALLPLQTDPLLSSLYRTPKRPSSPSRQNNKGSISTSLGASLQLSTQHIDVRAVALRSFRDKVILPLAPRLKARLSMVNRQDNFQETAGYQQPRLQQMFVAILIASVLTDQITITGYSCLHRRADTEHPHSLLQPNLPSHLLEKPQY